MTIQRHLALMTILNLILNLGVVCGDHPAIAKTTQLSHSLNSASALTALPDGDYQICSQPDSQDWRDGAGVCFRFTKVAAQFDGYYGYPHSDNFVCFRGQVTADRLTGEALALSWAGDRWLNLLPTPFRWDQEGRLLLSNGTIVHRTNRLDERFDWIHFKTATLDISDFYQYPSPRMRAAADLCPWP